MLCDVEEGQSAKIEWTRNKFTACTPYVIIQSNKEVTFDYVFEINTIISVKEHTYIPNQSKMGKLRVILEKDNEVIAETDFNMNNFDIDEFKQHKLSLKPVAQKESIEKKEEEIEQEENKEEIGASKNYIMLGLRGIPQDKIRKQLTLQVENLDVQSVVYNSP